MAGFGVDVLNSGSGIAGLFTAQKTINSLLSLNDENNILTLFNTISGEIQKIKVKNDKNCSLNNG